jgi:hypothetical protein
VPERIAKMVSAIQRLFADMGVDVVEERMLRFIVQEIHNGKSLEEALNEPYITNNTRPEWRKEILERPEVVRAVEEEMEKTFKGHGGGSGSD